VGIGGKRTLMISFGATLFLPVLSATSPVGSP